MREEEQQTPVGDPSPQDDANGPLLDRVLFTAQEVAESMSISTSMVRQLTVCGDLPCRRIGRLVRYTRDDVQTYIDGLDERGYRVVGTR